MRNKELATQKQRLDDLFDRINEIPIDALELKSHWARYLCVLVSGFIENSVRLILSEYSRSVSSPVVANYVEHQLKNFQNPKMEKVLNLVGAFNPIWQGNLATATEGQLKDAVNSIVANRHRIAHGGSVGISYHTIRNYYQDCIIVIEMIEKECS